MKTEEVEYIEPTQEHVGQMVEVSNDKHSNYSKSKLIAIVNEDGFRFITHGSYWPFPVGWQYARIPRPLTYAERQVKCGLKVGDRVKFARKFETGEGGYKLPWLTDLNRFIGHIGHITRFEGAEDGRGGCVVVEGIIYVLPYFVLKKVETQYREIQCDIGAKVVRINLNNKPTEYTLHNIFVDSDGCKFGIVKDLSNNWDVIELCDLRIEVQ